MKPNRFDDLENLYTWLESRIKAVESRQIRQEGVLLEEQKQIKADLQRWEGLTVLLSLAILLLLADRLWQ